LNNVPYWETSFIESLKVERFEERLKQLRSSEMLAHREMEKPDFSSAQVCSNDRVPYNTQLPEEMKYIGCPNGYSTHTVTGYFHMATVDCIILLF